MTFTLPPDDRAVGDGNPPEDMNGVVDALLAMGAAYNVQSSAFSGGADPTGSTAADTAFADAITACASDGRALIVPGGTYKLSSGSPMDWKTAGLQVIGPDGAANTKITQHGTNVPIVQLAGQGQRVRGLTLAYAAQEPSTNTSSQAMTFGDDMAGSCFESSFEDIYVQLAAQALAIDPSITTAAGLFSCYFRNIHVLGYSINGIYLVGNNGGGGADCTGCVFDNTYVHNNFTGSDANSTSWPVYLQAWDECVFNQLNIEHAEVFDSDAIALVSAGTVTINGLHLEHLELSGNPGWGHVYVSHATTVNISGLSIRFPTMTGTSYNSIVRLNGTEGPKCFIRGLNEPSDSGATYNSTHPLVDFNSATNGYVSLEGVSASQATTLEINAGTGCALSAPNVTPGAFTSFGTGGLGNVLNTSSGTSQIPVAGTWYYSAIYIPVAIPVTGILAPVDGGTGGTDKWMAALWSATGGTALAHSSTSGTTTAASGSKFKMPFTSVLWVAPGIYIIGIQSNGTTARMELFPNNLEGFITGSVTGVFGTVASLSPSASYTQNAGPMVMTY